MELSSPRARETQAREFEFRNKLNLAVNDASPKREATALRQRHCQLRQVTLFVVLPGQIAGLCTNNGSRRSQTASDITHLYAPRAVGIVHGERNLHLGRTIPYSQVRAVVAD